MQKFDLNLPTPVKYQSSWKFARSLIEHEKQRLLAIAMNNTPPEYKKPPFEEFVTASEVAREFRISERTMARMIKAMQQAEAA